jgi:hypothetical protein
MGIGEIVGVIFIIIAIVFILIGVGTATSPVSQAVNQTASSLPHYFIGAFSSAVSGGILIILGIVFFIIGAFVISHSSSQGR